jgi:hypothetical protein
LHFPDPDHGNNATDNLRWAPIEAFRVGLNNAANLGPTRRGSDLGHAKLTEADIPTIRGFYRAGYSILEIADRFGLSGTAIRLILVGQTWAHVPDPLGPLAMRSSSARPDDGGGVKLTLEKVAELRRLKTEGVSHKALAARFGVSLSMVNKIVQGRAWRAV